MAIRSGSILDKLRQKGLQEERQLVDQPYQQYRGALEKSGYESLGRNARGALDYASNYLAGSGPLADSGAARTLPAGMISRLIGQTNEQIGERSAGFLGDLLGRRVDERYQIRAEKRKKKASGGVGGAIKRLAGGAIGAVTSGNPLGAVTGALASGRGSQGGTEIVRGEPWWGYR